MRKLPITSVVVLVSFIVHAPIHLRGEEMSTGLQQEPAIGIEADQRELLVGLAENVQHNPNAAVQSADDILQKLPTDDPTAHSVVFLKGLAFGQLKMMDSVESIARNLSKLGNGRSNSYAIAASLTLQGLADKMKDSTESSIRKWNQALSVWESLGDTLGRAETLHVIGQAYQEQGINDSALYYYEQELIQRKTAGGWLLIASTHTNIGNAQERLGKFEEALESHNRSLALKKPHGDRVDLSGSLSNIGNIYYQQGRYAKALEYFMQALEIQEELGNKQLIARSLNSIGAIYYTLSDYSSAVSFFIKSLDIKKELGDKRGEANSLSNIGETYMAMGSLDEAMSFLLKSLQIDQELSDKWGMSYSLENIAHVLQKKGNLEEALSYHKTSLEIRKEIGDQTGYAQTLLEIGEILAMQASFDSALQVTEQAKSLAVEIGALELQKNSYLQSSQLYEQTGHFQEALRNHKLYKTTYDSIIDSDSESKIAELLEQYKTREQGQEIEILEKEKQIQRLWMMGLICGLILLLAIAILIYNRFLVKAKAHKTLSKANRDLQDAMTQLETTQQQLIHAEKMASLGQLTAGIAHEIKNPLNFVNNFAEVNDELISEIREALAKDDHLKLADVQEIIEDFSINSQHIVTHGRRANNIVQSMLVHSSGLSGTKKRIELNELVKEQLELACHGGLEGQLDVEIATDYGVDVGQADIVPAELGKVFLNLFDNALDSLVERKKKEGTPYQPRLSVTTRREVEIVEIEISDNGLGIDPVIKDKVFQPFFTTKPPGSGTGLGLSLSYEIITRAHSGTIEVFNNEETQGAIVLVKLPCPVLE